MVQVDLSSILAVSPSELSAQEKEDLFNTIIIIDLDKNLPPDKLGSLFGITQEVLKYKGDQVDSLLADLDILATSHDNDTGGGEEELREELAKTGKEAERLLEELQNKERELAEEKSHVEKLISEVSELQKEKHELRREIFVMQQEKQAVPTSENNEEHSEYLENLKDTIQYKNKHILQLLSDVEMFEKENESLQLKLSKARQELSEATTNITKLSGENISLRESNYDLHEKVTSLEEKNTGLVSQVSELVSERRNKDAQLDHLIDALEARVTKWQEILSHKDNELAELRARLADLQASTPHQNHAKNYGILTQSIEKQEIRIEELQDQLVQATKDLTKSTQLLQQFKKKAEARDSEEETPSSIEVLKEDLQKCHARIAFLEEKLNDAEQDAQARAEESTELIIQLREYEDGIYGLKEARHEIKNLKTQVKVRDKQILKLVEQANLLHLKTTNDETNGEKYLLEEDDDDNIEKLSSPELKTQLHQIQQTAINLSMQNYDLRAEVIKLKEELKDSGIKEVDVKDDETTTDNVIEETEEYKALHEKFYALVDENEGLRKGLHEILESVRNHDGTSNVAIESECLESLLEALDSRHISGWYQPAMRLQAELNKTQGQNKALREQMRESRLRESYFQAELQAALIRIAELEKLILESNDSKPVVPVPLPRQTVQKKELEIYTEQEEEIEEILEEVVEIEDEETEIIIPVLVQEEIREEDLNLIEEQLNGNTADEKPEIEEPDVQESNEIEKLEKAVQTDIDADKGISDEPPNSTGSPKEIEEVVENGGAPERTNSLMMSKFTRIEKNEDELREKCEELKVELEAIRNHTESTLIQLNENKEKLSAEVGEIMKKVEEQLTKFTNQSGNPANELVVTAFQAQESKLERYESELNELRKKLAEKEALLDRSENQIKELQQQLEESSTAKEAKNESHILALKETISSLQSIISQKEEVIARYQKLLQESSEEYGKLMEQYRSTETNVKKHSTPREKITDSKAVSVLMEKWLARVHILEDEVCQLTHHLNEANAKLADSEEEIENWKQIAASNEEKVSEEVLNKLSQAQIEIEELETTIDKQKVDFETAIKEKVRGETLKQKKKEDELKGRLKEYESEIMRLKNQLSTRSTRSRNTNSAKKECLLLDRIKVLEDELSACKSRHENNLQMRRDKCAEEFSKWEEKKRLQTNNERLKIELRDRMIQTETLETQISRLKQIISRMERERISLQRRLRTSQDLATKAIIMKETKEAQIEDDKIGYGSDTRLEATPVPTITPRSQTESAGSSVYNEEAKTKGRSRRDLEKAVIALKKVIAKLRAENSQFLHKEYVEQLQKELQRSQENYVDAVERTLALEEKLRDAETKINQLNKQTYSVDGGDRSEVMSLREQLVQKCELLSKVKNLLQRAMIRERQLEEQVTFLQQFVPPDKLPKFFKEVRQL